MWMKVWKKKKTQLHHESVDASMVRKVQQGFLVRERRTRGEVQRKHNIVITCT